MAAPIRKRDFHAGRQLQAERTRLARDDCAAQNVGLADEVGDEGGPRRVINFGDYADLLDAATIDDGDAIRHGEGLLLVVRDEHESDAELFLQPLQLGLHRAT